jgi:hypothetical protein
VNAQLSRPAAIACLLIGGSLLALPTLSSAAPDRPRHPLPNPGMAHPVHPPHPTHIVRGTATPTAVVQPTPTPQLNSVPCPAEPTYLFTTKVSKLFYGYPGGGRTLHASGFFRLDPFSNGLSPTTEPASLTLTDDNGVVILGMPHIQFVSTGGGGFAASNDQGFVSFSPFAGAYMFSFTFDNPNFPPGFFRFRYHLCLNVGDDGMSETLVCQMKPNDGFVCHE